MKKDLINRIVLIVSASLLFITSLFLIILSNIHHGKKYVYEGATFVNKAEGYSDYEVVKEKVIIEFVSDTEFKITHYKGEEKNEYDCLYIRLEGNYIKTHGVNASLSGTLYIDAFKMKDISTWNSNAPADRVFVCKTNYVLKIILIVLIIISAITFVIEGLYHLIDFIKWKKYLKEKENTEHITEY